MARLVECLPNFSEEKIKKDNWNNSRWRKIESVKLLDYSSDEDHNRSVVTMIENRGCKKLY